MNSLKDKFEAATLRVVAARKALEEAEAFQDALYAQIAGRGNKGSATNAKTSIANIRAMEGTAKGRILALLRSNKEKVWDNDAFFEAFPDIPKPSVRALLFILQRERKAEKVGRGKWRAK